MTEGFFEKFGENFILLGVFIIILSFLELDLTSITGFFFIIIGLILLGTPRLGDYLFFKSRSSLLSDSVKKRDN